MKQTVEEIVPYIFMFHMFKQPQLSVGSFGVDDGLKRPRQLLHSDLQTSHHINGRADWKKKKVGVHVSLNLIK